MEMTLESALSSKRNLDIHLDNEFVFLAQFIHVYKNRVAPEDESRCVAWLQRLLDPTRDGTIRIVRNTYLAELLLAMQSGQLCGPFGKEPEKGALSLTNLGTPPDVKGVCEPPWLATVINAPIPGSDQTDERTYISTQAHPDGKSAYAYVAVSTTDHDHWVEPLAASDNESTVNVTPPRSHVAPSACTSCASVYPIREDIELPCPQDVNVTGERSKTFLQGEFSTDDDLGYRSFNSDPLVRFYGDILTQIETLERTGCCQDAAFVADLLQKIKEQATDLALNEIHPEDLQYELLRRLKIKLMNRKQQARKMTRAEPTPAYQQEVFKDTEDCGVDLDVALDEQLWDSSARRELSPTNMMLLESVYPPELVHRFAKALIRERCALIARMRAEHQVLANSLQNDLQKDVEESLDRFKRARALWVVMLRATQELHHVKRQQYASVAGAEKGTAIRETVRDIEEAMVALDGEGKRGTDLADQLISEQQELYKAEREAERHTRRLLSHNEALRMSLETVEAHEASQLKRINELERQVRERAQT